MGQDSSVGIATRYGLDVPETVSRGGGGIFRTRPVRTWDPPNILYDGYRVFPGGKTPGRGVDNPLPSGAEVKERVEIYMQIM